MSPILKSLRDALAVMLAPYAAAPGQTGEACRQLNGWDGEFGCDSAGAAIFVWTMMELGTRTYGALLDHELAQRFCNGRKARPRLHRLLLDRDDPLRHDIERRTARPYAAIVAEAFEAAVGQVVKACGADAGGWRWGHIQRAWLGAPLAVLPLVGRYFVALDGGFPGDDFTVNPSRSVPVGARLYSLIGASSRFLCDLSKPDEAWFAHSSGHSGDAFSAYFRNLSGAWLEFRYFRSALWPAAEVPDPLERLVIDPQVPPRRLGS